MSMTMVWQSKMRMNMPIMTTKRTVVNQGMMVPVTVGLVVAMVSVWFLMPMRRVVRPVP